MLVLSRKKNESVLIGDSVKVTVVEIRGDKVRLGFEAPGEVRVHREEVWVRIQEENKRQCQQEQKSASSTSKRARKTSIA